jgi:hypothetical protein
MLSFDKRKQTENLPKMLTVFSCLSHTPLTWPYYQTHFT